MKRKQQKQRFLTYLYMCTQQEINYRKYKKYRLPMTQIQKRKKGGEEKTKQKTCKFRLLLNKRKAHH